MLVLGIVLGFTSGVLLMRYLRPGPVTVLRRKARRDLATRLENGLPVHPENDYERHLYALSLRLKGKTKEEVTAALWSRPMPDIHQTKRVSYVNDVVSSVIVGFKVKLPTVAFLEVR